MYVVQVLSRDVVKWRHGSILCKQTPTNDIKLPNHAMVPFPKCYGSSLFNYKLSKRASKSLIYLLIDAWRYVGGTKEFRKTMKKLHKHRFAIRISIYL